MTRTPTGRARSVLLTALATFGLMLGLLTVPQPTPPAQAIPMAEPCGRSDLAAPIEVAFTRKSGSKTLTLDYATLHVHKVIGVAGWYCVQVGSEYRRKVWLAESFCSYKHGAWNCGAGHDYVYLGNKYAFAEDVKVKPANRVFQTYRLRTASGNYYYAKSGWLYG